MASHTSRPSESASQTLAASSGANSPLRFKPGLTWIKWGYSLSRGGNERGSPSPLSSPIKGEEGKEDSPFKRGREGCPSKGEEDSPVEEKERAENSPLKGGEQKEGLFLQGREGCPSKGEGGEKDSPSRERRVPLPSRERMRVGGSPSPLSSPIKGEEGTVLSPLAGES